MAKQTLNVGAVANDGTGDTLRAGMQKVNENFTETYARSETMTDMVGGTVPNPPHIEPDATDWVLTGHGEFHPMHLFSQYGEMRVASSTAEINFEAEGVGSTTLSANHFSYRGKMVKSMLMGYWAKSVNTNLTLRIRLETAFAVAVSFQIAGDTVTLVGHGITAVSAENMDCTFPTISNTTGISINTTYFVKYLSANTFQISATRTFVRLTPTTGAAINLTGADGTGTVLFSTIIHAKLFEQTNRFRNGGGHFQIDSMTTAMTLGTAGTVNMHGNFSLYEGDSEEMIGLHTENLVLGINTTIPIKIVCSAQWSVNSAVNHITSTNYLVH